MAENISTQQNTSIITTLASALQSPKVSSSPLVKSQVEQALEQIIEGTSPEPVQFSPDNLQQKLKTPIKAKTPMKKSNVEQNQFQFTEEQLKNDLINLQSSKVEQEKEVPMPFTKTEQICKQIIDYNIIIDRLLKPKCIDPQHCQSIYQQYDSDYTITIADRCPYCVKRQQNEVAILKILQQIFKEDQIKIFTSFNFNLIQDDEIKQRINSFITQRKYEIIQEFNCQTNQHSEQIILNIFNQDFQQILKQKEKDQEILKKMFKLNQQRGKSTYVNILLDLIFVYVFNLPIYVAIPIIQKMGQQNQQQNLRNIKLDISQITDFYWKNIENCSSQQRFLNSLKYLMGDEYSLLDVIKNIFQCIKDLNPGLDFLRDSQEYLNLYYEFILTRLLFLTNGYLNKNISETEIEKINLLKIFFQVSQCQNVNDETQIFSYTSFYVCYCLFYQLDSEKANQLTREQLSLYGLDLSLQGKQQFNQIILDRYFNMFQQNERLSFGAFSILIFITVDKTTWQATQIFFELCDLDGDGILSKQDLQELYNEIDRIRIENNFLTIQSSFETFYDQLLEISAFKPFTLQNIINTQLQNAFFNFVSSLQKLIEFQVKSNSFQHEPKFNEWASMMYDFMDQTDDDQVELDENALID